MIARAEFPIVRWDAEVPFDDSVLTSPQSRVVVDKTFPGDISGSSLTCQISETQAAYVASERLRVSIGPRTGSMVIQHGGGRRWSRGPTVRNDRPRIGIGRIARNLRNGADSSR